MGTTVSWCSTEHQALSFSHEALAFPLLSKTPVRFECVHERNEAESRCDHLPSLVTSWQRAQLALGAARGGGEGGLILTLLIYELRESHTIFNTLSNFKF